VTQVLRLGSTTVPPNALLHRRTLPESGIVHLGLGNFHRAHQAVYTAHALATEDGPWGILGVASRSADVATALREQDHLYCVLEASPGHTRLVVPAVHTGTLVAAREPEAVLAALAAPSTRIVTLTVTEHGYKFSPRTHRLDLDNPAVQADLRGTAPPTTTIGLLVRAFQRRASAGADPVTVLSCDNLAGNGQRTEELVREFVGELPGGEREELLDWLAGVTFPSSVVDRIVPATTDEYRAMAARHLGVQDLVPVPSEPFSQWVLEDRFAAGRPRWETGGAVLTGDVEPYELLKLRLLNGTHSLIAYLGILDGRETIPAAIGQPFIEQAARHVLDDDYLPTVTEPEGVVVEEYIEQLFTRWSNSALAHRTTQVGTDGSVKLAQRLPVPVRMHLENGRVPQHLALTLAAYLCCLTSPSPGLAAEINDPARPRLVALHNESAGTAAFVRAVLADGLLGQDLADSRAFADRTAELADLISRSGPAAAAKEAARAG
jgi:fructuronate reductase